MSKRKRKSRREKGSKADAAKRRADSRSDSSNKANDSDQGATKREAKTNAPKPPKKSQRGLLVVGLLLLSVAVFMNVDRWLNSSVKLPDSLRLPTEEIDSRPLASPSRGGEKRFAALTAKETGVDFAHPVIPDHPMAHLYYSSPASGGTAIGDVNGDGRPDLFIASGPAENRLYLQTETPMRFDDATEAAGVGGGDVWACGATMVDVNADGRLDIYVANYDSPNALYMNLGNGKFADLAAEYGVNLTDASLEGVFADYDRDGWLDLYLLTYRYENPDGMPQTPPIVQRDGNPAIDTPFAKYYEVTDDAIGYGTVGRSDGLLKNNGDGTFTNVSIKAGIHGVGHGQSATWWDFNHDGFMDIHVGNDFNDPDRLYRNNGNGTFTDIVREAAPHVTWFSMGADAGDVNGDGLFDLLSSDMSSTTHFKQKTTMGAMGNSAEFLATAVPRQYMRNALLLNSGTERFKEAAYLTGLDSTDWTWCVKLADFDCDGKLDAFFTNGSVRMFTDSDRTLTLSERKGKTEWELYKDTEPLKEANLAFQNRSGDGKLSFEDVSKTWGLDHVGVSMSAAHGDLDGDGDVDLVVANLDEPLTIYRNDSVEHQRITMRLHGRGGNRYGVGAKVEVAAPDGSGKQLRELQPSRGFLASNQPVLHFGVGDADTVDVVVTWPDGGVQEISSLATGKHYDIVEAEDLPREQPATPTPLFASLDTPIKHVENEFDDYAVQSLIPHRMSRLGPSLAAADANGDGAIDYFLGGAAGQAGQLLIRDGSMGFRPGGVEELQADQAAEDMGALWLDVDNDGDEDLFVVGGGNEFQPDSDAYLWRMYLNDGEGKLTRDKNRLPDVRVSGGPVAAMDFDRDGDVDLFVGGRQVPGKYPLAAKSYLLRNDEGTFVDATAEWSEGLSEVGMVTGAIWSDVDEDDDADLLVTTEWGAIHLFRNADGKLTDDSEAAGLSARKGWWTGISSSDLDGDGDIDYVATNLGTNTKYHADDEHPFRLFYGDFEGNGNSKLVEAEYENDTLFPVRGKSCSTHAMPSLAEKFPTYKEFALASLTEIYTPSCLDESYEVSANWLYSVALINDGKGVFAMKSLPSEAQMSPGFGCVISDWTGDGIPDVFLSQNFFSPQPETGNFDGGLGCLLAGVGDGTFRAMPTSETGIVIPQDATAAVFADVSRDGFPDVVVATNNGALRFVRSDFKQSQAERPAIVKIVFDGAASRSALAGTRVQLDAEGLPPQTFEIASGSGYLSQLPPELYFATGGKDATLTIKQPGQDPQTLPVPASEQTVKVPPPL